jgi:3-hydroxyisobutyrate dehydrogenase
MKVGFIGTGNMGNPMASNVLKAGHELVVHDLRREATINLLEAGAVWADSPQAVAEQSEVVLGSLPNPSDVEQVFLGERGILAGMRSGQAYFDLTTSDPLVSRRLAGIATERGVHFLDSPVSGGVQGARAGTLAVMVGGDQAVFEQYKPVLSAIGKNVFYLGGVGNGNVAKLVNNMLAFVNRAAASEGLILGVKAGVDPQLLLDCIKASSGNSFSIGNMDTTVFKGDFSPTFTLDLATKDINLALQMAKDMKVPMRVAPNVQQLMIEGQAQGLGQLASAVVITLLEKAAGVEVRTQ